MQANETVCTQILVPIYNEGENVRVLYSGLLDARVDFDELKFVYDIDDDTSLPYIGELRRGDPRVQAEKNAFGPGVIRALRWGFAHARPGPVIVVMGDNSDKLSIIPRMVELWAAGATVVAPSRYMAGGKQIGGGTLKKTLSRFAGRTLRMLGFPTADPTNNFKLYDGVWLRGERIESTAGFEVALELCFKAYLAGRQIVELPTVWRDRTRGESRFKLLGWLPHYLRWYLRAVAAVVQRRMSPGTEARPDAAKGAKVDPISPNPEQ